MANKGGYTKLQVQLPKNRRIVLYAGTKVAAALKLIKGMTLFDAVKIHQLLEAVYHHGKKAGAAEAIEATQHGLARMLRMQAKIPHRNPGRPRRKRK